MQAVISFVAAYLFIAVVLLEGLYLLAFHRDCIRELLVATLMIGGGAFLLSLVANHFIQDPRPFIVGGFKPLIHSSTDNGFPSDHTLLLATTAAIVMVASRPAGFLGLALAVLVGLARVYVGVHHLTDIIGSLVIVGLASLVYLGAVHAWKARFSPDASS